MKTLLPNLMILTALSGLSGCGSQGAAGKLEVSQSFATTNTSFGGGLIISGKHLSSGRTFSKSILSGKEMRINLEQGAWKISAVAWDGGGSPGSEKLFAGNPFCGSVIANLENSSTVVDLTIAQSNCHSAEFTAGHVDGSNELKSFDAIITCNTFFNPAISLTTGSISSQIINGNSANDNFCESTSLAEDLKSKVQAVKIYAMEIMPGQLLPTTGFSTGCMQGVATTESMIYPTNAPNPYNGYTFKLPFSNLPLIISTYKDTACNEPVAVYPFENGLKEWNPNFDHLLQTRTTSGMKLLLPGSDMKKVFSPFIGLMPFVKRYNSGIHSKFETQPSGLGTYQFHGRIGPNLIIIENQNNCTSVTGQTNMTGATCSVRPDGKGVEIAFTGSGGGSANVTVNGSIYYIYLAPTQVEELRYESQKTSMELLGHNGDNSMDTFFGLNYKDDKAYGALSIARDMFAGNGAGGVIGISDLSQTFENSCLGTVVNKEIKVYNFEKLSLETYRVNVHNSVVSSPTKFTCVTSDMDPTDCTAGSTFDKRMLIYDYKISAITPMIVMEFSCSKLIGRLEVNSLEIESSRKHEAKEILNWNTETSANLADQRFERLLIANDYNLVSGSWIHKNEIRTMARLRKTDSDNYEVWHYGFSAHRDVVNYDQKLELKRLKTQTTTTLHFLADEAAISDTDKTYVLTNATFSTLQNRTPTSEFAEKYFAPNDPFPQSGTTSSLSLNPLSTDFLNANLINDVAGFAPKTLGESSFTNSFGGTFFTSP